MEALMETYGDASSESDSDSKTTTPTLPATSKSQTEQTLSSPLPPPPLSLLDPPNSFGSLDYPQTGQPSRVRSFPHVEGNYALHVYIPVSVPSASKKEMGQFLKRVASVVNGLHVVDIDVPLSILCKEDNKLEQVALGREFHISLGRTVPIRVHQIDSIVTMLRQKLQFQKRYWIDFNKWEVFVNDDQTRSFLSLEVIMGGLPEITKQIQAVNEVYKLHNLPKFYKDPRPHISLAWAQGDHSDSLKTVIEEGRKTSSFGVSLPNRIFTSKFGGIECKIDPPFFVVGLLSHYELPTFSVDKHNEKASKLLKIYETCMCRPGSSATEKHSYMLIFLLIKMPVTQKFGEDLCVNMGIAQHIRWVKNMYSECVDRDTKILYDEWDFSEI